MSASRLPLARCLAALVLCAATAAAIHTLIHARDAGVSVRGGRVSSRPAPRVVAAAPASSAPPATVKATTTNTQTQLHACPSLGVQHTDADDGADECDPSMPYDVSDSGVAAGAADEASSTLLPGRTTPSPAFSHAHSALSRLADTANTLPLSSPLSRWEHPRAWLASRVARGESDVIDDAVRASVEAQWPPVYEENILAYNEAHFREKPYPIMWTDHIDPNDVHNSAHIHWNAAAERRMVDLLRQQQFPDPPVDCTKAKYIIADQWGAGFFSRYNIGMELMMRAMAVPDRQIIMGWIPMGIGGSSIQARARDDYAGEGMNQYFMPLSQCQNHPHVVSVLKHARYGVEGLRRISQLGIPRVDEWSQLLKGGALHEKQFVHMCDTICHDHGMRWENIWMRRATFDPRTRNMDPMTLAINAMDHSMEHIYARAEPSNNPLSPHEYGKTLDSRNQMFGEFVISIATAFFYRPSARIQAMRALMSEYWTRRILTRRYGREPTEDMMLPEYFAAGERERKSGKGRSVEEMELALQRAQEDGSESKVAPTLSFPSPLSNSAAIFVRRGDKCQDDQYCRQTGRFRGIGLFMHGIYLEEKRRGRVFSSIFVMTDDGPALDELLHSLGDEFRIDADGEEGFDHIRMSTEDEIQAAYSSGDDERIARALLRGRILTFNPYSPASCFNPSNRQGFESFLASLTFLLHHNAFVVGHESSNVAQAHARMLFVANQLDPGIHRTARGALMWDVGSQFTQWY